MTIFFTSDTHFGHRNIITYCNRPFRNREGMNNALIRRWNHVVKPDDEVYHLGDVSFVDNEWTGSILRELNGTKYLAVGNHDKRLKVNEFKVVAQEIILEIPTGELVVMSHHYQDKWFLKDQGSWHFHGHAHGNPIPLPYHPRRVDVGVDCWGFRPVTFEQIVAKGCGNGYDVQSPLPGIQPTAGHTNAE